MLSVILMRPKPNDCNIMANFEFAEDLPMYNIELPWDSWRVAVQQIKTCEDKHMGLKVVMAKKGHEKEVADAFSGVYIR